MPDADGNPTPEEAAATIAAARQQQADAAALQEQLTQAQARNLELEVAALHTANPDLPDAAFTGDDLAAIQANVTTARATADHVRQQLEAAANGAANPPRTRGAQRHRPHQVRPRPEELTNGPFTRRSRQVQHEPGPRRRRRDHHGPEPPP